MQTPVDIAWMGNGYVTASQATDADIPRRKLADALSEGELV